MSFIRAHKVEVGIVLLAVVVRVLYFSVALDAHNGNLLDTSRAADGYTVIAENVIAGHGFSNSGGPPYTPNSFRMPLQPYFLAVAHALPGGWWAALALTLAIGRLLPLFGMYITEQLFQHRRLAVAAGILLALEPVSILFSVLFYSETLFTLFLLSSVLYLFAYFRNKRLLHLALSSSFLGLAMLVRPTVEYLPLLYIVLILWDGRNSLSWPLFGRAAFYGFVFLLALSPWLLRNYREFGIIAITPQTGVNLYANLVPSVLSIERGTSFDEEYQNLQAQGVSGPNQTGIGEGVGYVGKASALLFEHPAGLLFTAGLVGVTFFTHDGVLDLLRLAKLAPSERLGAPALALLFTDPRALWGHITYFITTPAVFVLIMRIVWYAVTVLFCVGIFAYVRRYGLTPSSLAALGTVAYFALVTIIVGLTVNARYRLPVEALIIPFALYGLLYLKTLWRRSQ